MCDTTPPAPHAVDPATIRGVSGILDSLPRGNCPRDCWATLTTTDGTMRAALFEVGALIRREKFASVAERNRYRLSATEIDALTLSAGLALSFAASEICHAVECMMRDRHTGKLPRPISECIESCAEIVGTLDSPWFDMITATVREEMRDVGENRPEVERASLTSAEIIAGSCMIDRIASMEGSPMGVPCAVMLEGMCKFVRSRLGTDEEGGTDAGSQ